MHTNLFCGVGIWACLLGAASVQAGERISIVGSSTVYPFAKAVINDFADKYPNYPKPQIQAAGSGGGFQLFCQGRGSEFPDIANASRKIQKAELDHCAQNGVTEILELKIGYDGIVLASHTAVLDLSRTDLYLALAAEVPDPSGGKTLVPNPYKRWKEVNLRLPDSPIRVLGPPATSGTRDAFEELAMEKGCEEFASIRALKKQDKGRFREVCRNLRKDGAYVEAGEIDALIVQDLKNKPDELGVFGYSYLALNEQSIRGALVDGVAPDFAAIASGRYPLSRPLYIYVKKNNIATVPGLKLFLQEFIQETTLGPGGSLIKIGLIPLAKDEFKVVRDQLAQEAVLGQ